MAPIIHQVVETEVLVIGGGAAGVRAAIEACRQGCQVTILSISKVGYGNNSAISYGGFSAAIKEGHGEDSPQRHYEDTMVGGCWLNQPELARILTNQVPSEVKALERMGVYFEKDTKGKYVLMPRGGHSVARRLTTSKHSGLALLSPLVKYADGLNIAKLEGYKAVRLLMQDGRISGILGINQQGEWAAISAKSVVLATGGGGALYPETTNVPAATGEGYVLAYEAGLTLQDMEFVQFVIVNRQEPGVPRRLPPVEVFLLKGAKLKNADEEDLIASSGITTTFTRDVITRIVAREMMRDEEEGGLVYLDLSELPRDEIEKIENLKKDAIKVHPAAHFFMGGVKVDGRLGTSIEGLYTAGEVMGGVHGANRLGGNALAETFVFGSMAGSLAARLANRCGEVRLFRLDQAHQAIEKIMESFGRNQGGKYPNQNLAELQTQLTAIMGECAGAVRHRKKLEEGLSRLEALKDSVPGLSFIKSKDGWSLFTFQHKLTVSEMILKAALKREESRGAHFREDFPNQDDKSWRVNICIQKDEKEKMKLTLEPVLCL
ncbi:MAG: FAD-binding protein [Deltaproteobacteria bacterium]|nr:FAD-binding protein [Deltaproteobacteria bacterium]MBW2084661.1 FAD-binding protein [Deltaproteobacteria bacterium]